ncbi:MAG: hypothetical protein IBX55_05125 [Methyloprofundus sp.]|nr:hypothetical protein [Methyloprofundus sp.]MBW6452923.1 hypothetical protein [Methyloprofundus sp.]
MPNSKTYLTVPYAEKDAAKALGAKWDAAQKKWYAPAGANLSSFAKWQTEAPSNATKSSKPKTQSSTNKILLGVVTSAKDKKFIAYSGDQPPWI